MKSVFHSQLAINAIPLKLALFFIVIVQRGMAARLECIGIPCRHVLNIEEEGISNIDQSVFDLDSADLIELSNIE
jgi:hypothetical protein